MLPANRSRCSLHAAEELWVFRLFSHYSELSYGDSNDADSSLNGMFCCDSSCSALSRTGSWFLPAGSSRLRTAEMVSLIRPFRLRRGGRPGERCSLAERLIPAFLAQIAILLMMTGNLCAESIAVTVNAPRVGWKDVYLVGRWSPILVPVTLKDASNVQLEVSAVDPDGNRVSFLSDPIHLEAGEHQLEGVFKVGRLDGEIQVRVHGGDWVSGIPDRSSWLKFPERPSARLIVTVGDPPGFNFDSDESGADRRAVLAKASIADLPTNPLAYDGVASLVLSDAIEMSEGQSTALRTWVSSGGRLTISLPHDVAAARQRLLGWIPVTIADSPVTVREFGSLEAFAGKNIRIPQTSPLSIPQLQFTAGEVLSASRSTPFLVRVPYGMGSVTLLSMDLKSPPLAEWKGLQAFCSRVVGADARTDIAEKGASRGSQLSSTGISDISTQLHAIQEHFDKIHRVSPWLVLSCLLGLLLIVGPLDYLIVHRLLKRPYLTWVTFPLVAAVVSIGAALFGSASNGAVSRANQINITNVDYATATLRTRHYVNLYSPRTVQSSLKMIPQSVANDGTEMRQARVCWEGVPEATFGGMLRSSGLERGASYEQQPDGELTGVPILQWSSKALVGESTQPADGLVECSLKASATGSLSGTILHRFSAPIEDWMVVYQNRVYRHLKTRDDVHSLPFAPKQLWRVEQPSVFQRELRPYLTGILTMATARFGARNTKEITQQQSTYDPLSLNPFEVVRILTFFEEVSGDRYTGLSNQLLNYEDCSHLLKLGRAILFGRLTQPVARIELDQRPLESDSESSFVRLILPVEKSTELMKELKRVVPD